MKNIKEILMSNLPWIITTIFAAGCLVATIKLQEKTIDSLQIQVSSTSSEINSIKIQLSSLKSIENDINSIKYDINEIRRVVYKPIANNNQLKENVDINKAIVVAKPLETSEDKKIPKIVSVEDGNKVAQRISGSRSRTIPLTAGANYAQQYQSKSRR